jgi:hypothetical protein
MPIRNFWLQLGRVIKGATLVARVRGRQHALMRRFINFGFCILLICYGNALCETRLFDDNALLEVELAGPLATLMSAPQDRNELPFSLRVGGSDFDIEVRLRGKSRLLVCEFLPMRLNFKTGATTNTLFTGQDKIKLVVPCRHSERYAKDVLEEYAAYRIFNLLTPASYRVRLLHVTFSDTDSASFPGNGRKYAFLIESDEHLAERLHGQVSEIPGVALAWLEPAQTALMYVFQFLIGNTDWSLVTSVEEQACCHNGTLIEKDEKILYVPYDFDLSGLVSASYANPAPELRLRSVRQRRYRGFCMDRAYVEEALDVVISQRQPIVDLIKALPLLTDKDKQARIDYLEQFFRSAQQREKLLKTFDRHCID